MKQDLAGGLGLLTIAGLYAAGTARINDNALSDDVGAAGLPWMLAILLAAVAVALIARALLAGCAAGVPAAALAGGTAAADEDEEDEAAPIPRAVGLLLFGFAYIAILPFAGYLPSVALLIIGIGLYEGTAWTWKLPAIAFAGAALYWTIFVKLLGVHQPAGLFFSGYLS